MQQIERRVFGRDYGGAGWATQQQANQIARLLDLRLGIRLLDVGASSGWPTLYLARTTGCKWFWPTSR